MPKSEEGSDSRRNLATEVVRRDPSGFTFFEFCLGLMRLLNDTDSLLLSETVTENIDEIALLRKRQSICRIDDI